MDVHQRAGAFAFDVKIAGMEFALTRSPQFAISFAKGAVGYKPTAPFRKTYGIGRRSQHVQNLSQMRTLRGVERNLSMPWATPWRNRTVPKNQPAASERQRFVREALNLLTPEQRQVIELAYYSGLIHGEIAEKLNQPLGTVKTRARLGMMKLPEALAQLLGESRKNFERRF
jgi:RNA polymerase sigma factor (sigma-70 family)